MRVHSIIESLNAYWSETEHIATVLQPPCDNGELRLLRDAFEKALKTRFLDDLTDYLMITNGFEFSGLTIFASRPTRLARDPRYSISGIIEANQEYRSITPEFESLCVFGRDSLSLYAYDFRVGAYQVRDSGCVEDVYNVFANLGDALFEAVRRALPAEARRTFKERAAGI